MARNGSGVYSLPAGSTVTDGTTATAEQHNDPIQDLETDANTARPVVAGGTGATTASGARSKLGLGTIATQDAGTFSSSGASNGKLIDGDANYDLKSSRDEAASRSHIRFYNPNGEIGSITTMNSATTYNTSSDARLKRDFRDFDSGAILDAMQMYEFDWRADGVRGFGPKAQELHVVFPEGATPGSGEPGDPDFEPWQWAGNPLVALLIREAQSLRERVAALEARI